MPNDYGISYYFYYVHPVIYFISGILGMLNSIVLANKELRKSGPFFQYSLVNSIGSTLASFLLGFLFLTNCNLLCPTSTTYLAQLFIIYCSHFLGGGYYLASGFIQIALGFQMYLAIKKSFPRLSNLNPYLVCLIIFGKIFYFFYIRI